MKEPINLDYPFNNEEESLEELYQEYNVTQQYHEIDEEFFDRDDEFESADESLLRVYDQVRKEEEEEEGKSREKKTNTKEIATIIAIALGCLLFIVLGIVGIVAFLFHERRWNKPRTLSHYATSDSGSAGSSSNGSNGSSNRNNHHHRPHSINGGGIFGDEASLRSASVQSTYCRTEVSSITDFPRDTFAEEMYNLDNDSFLNSLESVWPASDFSPGCSNITFRSSVADITRRACCLVQPRLTS